MGACKTSDVIEGEANKNYKGKKKQITLKNNQIL